MITFNNRYFFEGHFGEKAHLFMEVQCLSDLFEPEHIEMLWHDKEREEAARLLAKDYFEKEETLNEVEKVMALGRLYRLNKDHPEYEKWQFHAVSLAPLTDEDASKGTHKAPMKRVNILGLGDVGSTMALALSLYGKGVIGEIGLFDLDENRLSRWEQEINQIGEPLLDELPKVRVLTKENLFDCDLFAFTASVGVPPISVQSGDVRVVQFNGNSKLVSLYGNMAVEAGFKGIFAVVSDPVDQLCRAVYENTNKDEMGNWHGKGLRVDQIRGYGLGVMNGRASYFAKVSEIAYGAHGRVYGPHGKGLVVANHYSQGLYNEEQSLKLTELTITANLEMRKIGYKPYVAPAVASGAIAITRTLSGEWHYSCIGFDGFFYGCLNRRHGLLDIRERLDMSLELKERIKQSAEELNTQWESL